MAAWLLWRTRAMAGVALAAFAVLPLWPGFASSVGASGYSPHTGSLITPQSGASEPAMILGEVELKGNTADRLGSSAAISGDIVAAGAPQGGSVGQVFVFARSGKGFKRAAILTPGDTGANEFGYDVSMSGNTTIVGAPGGNGGGGAYIFTDTARGWKKVAVLHPPVNPINYFGKDVDISGNYAIVSNEDNHAYIYHSAGSRWVQSGVLSLPNSGSAGVFGRIVAIDGTTAAVYGATRDQAASVYLYAFNGGQWTQLANVHGTDVTGTSALIYSLGISGHTLAAGMADMDGQAGRVYIFTDQSGSWQQTAELTGRDTKAGDEFGSSISLSGSSLAVGAPGKSNGGAVYVFTESGGQWKQTSEYHGSDVRAGDGLGGATGVSGSLVVGGASEHQNGAVYVFGPGIGTIPPAFPIKVIYIPQVRRGNAQLVKVDTALHAHVDLRVTYPGGGGVTASGTTDRYGEWKYLWTVHAKNSGTATMSITVTNGNKKRHFTKHFRIL